MGTKYKNKLNERNFEKFKTFFLTFKKEEKKEKNKRKKKKTKDFCFQEAELEKSLSSFCTVYNSLFFTSVCVLKAQKIENK